MDLTKLFGRALLVAAGGLLAPQLHAQGTAFTYQGRLNDGGVPAGGNYDLKFTLYDGLTGGSIVGSPLTNAPVGVSNGLFLSCWTLGRASSPALIAGWKSVCAPTELPSRSLP
jgi:hypothetical protein